MIASAGLDPATGKRAQITRTVRRQRDAERELTNLLADIDRGVIADPGKLRLGDYLRDRWLPHVATRTRARTVERYETLIRTYIVPVAGQVPLAKLRPAHVQAVVDGVMAKGRTPRTAIGAYRVLSAALHQAVRWQLLGANPDRGRVAPQS